MAFRVTHFMKTIFHSTTTRIRSRERTRRILNRIISLKKVRLNRFVKNFVRKPIRSRFAPPATFPRGFCSKSLFGLCEIRLLNKYSFFPVLCIQHFALFFKRMSCLLLSGPRSRFYSRVYYVSCVCRFISTFGFARLCYS